MSAVAFSVLTNVRAPLNELTPLLLRHDVTPDVVWAAENLFVSVPSACPADESAGMSPFPVKQLARLKLYCARGFGATIRLTDDASITTTPHQSNKAPYTILATIVCPFDRQPLLSRQIFDPGCLAGRLGWAACWRKLSFSAVWKQCAMWTL